MATKETNLLNNVAFAAVNDKQRMKNQDILQPILYDLIALSRVIQQLHWNVTGPSFRPIHLHMDEILDLIHESIDSVGERLTATGHSPSGRIVDVAKNTEIEDVPTGFLRGTEVVKLAEHSVRRMSDLIRSRMAEVEDIDTATADLLHQIVMSLEKHHWMLAATAD